MTCGAIVLVSVRVMGDLRDSLLVTLRSSSFVTNRQFQNFTSGQVLDKFETAIRDNLNRSTRSSLSTIVAPVANSMTTRRILTVSNGGMFFVRRSKFIIKRNYEVVAENWSFSKGTKVLASTSSLSDALAFFELLQFAEEKFERHTLVHIIREALEEKFQLYWTKLTWTLSDSDFNSNQTLVYICLIKDCGHAEFEILLRMNSRK